MQSSFPIQSINETNPYGLTLRQVITTSGAVTLPARTYLVFAILVGGGAAGTTTKGGNGGEVSMGWVIPTTTCTIGASGSGVTSFGNIKSSTLLIANQVGTAPGGSGSGVAGTGWIVGGGGGVNAAGGTTPFYSGGVGVTGAGGGGAGFAGNGNPGVGTVGGAGGNGGGGGGAGTTPGAGGVGALFLYY